MRFFLSVLEYSRRPPLQSKISQISTPYNSPTDRDPTVGRPIWAETYLFAILSYLLNKMCCHQLYFYKSRDRRAAVVLQLRYLNTWIRVARQKRSKSESAIIVRTVFSCANFLLFIFVDRVNRL